MLTKLNISNEILNQIDHETDYRISQKCRKSFYFFLKEFWPIIIKEDPVYNWHIPYLCAQLQVMGHRAIARLPKLFDLVVNIPPGTTKTTVFSIAFPAWIWIAELPYKQYRQVYEKKGRKKTDKIYGSDIRIITGSYSQDITLKNSLATRDIIRSKKYATYFPEILIRKDQDVKSDYANTLGGSRFSTSVGARVMGTHAHIINIDDPIDPEQTLSDPVRIKANNFMDNLHTRKVDKDNTPVNLIMQRLHKHDPTGHVIEKGRKRETRIKHICLPGTTEYEIKPRALKKRYQDNMLDPVRLSMRTLNDLRVSLGSYGYGGQIGQDPRPIDGGMFSKKYFEIVKAAPASRIRKVRGWDLAATSELEAKINNSQPAYTAGVLMSWHEGIFYIEDVERFRGGPDHVRRVMKTTASRDPLGAIQDIPQDPGQAGKAQVRDLVGHLVGYVVKFSVESGDKILRAEPLSAQTQAFNVKLVEGAWNKDFIDEADYFPNGFKDQIDAAVRAFSRLTILQKAITSDDIGSPGGFKKETSYAM